MNVGQNSNRPGTWRVYSMKKKVGPRVQHYSKMIAERLRGYFRSLENFILSLVSVTLDETIDEGDF